MAGISKKYFDFQFEKMAKMVADGFSHTESRLGTVESRLTGVESEMLKVHDRLRTVEEKVDRALYKQYMYLENRVDKIEQHLGLKSV